jgi:hypothetical protein
MAKSFACRRTPQGIAAIEDTRHYLVQASRREAKQHGQHSPEAWKVSVILAVIYSATGDYEQVVSLLSGNVRVEKGKSDLKPMWMVWAGGLLAEAYFNLGRISDAMRVSEQGKPIAKGIDPSASDPLLQALFEQATAFEPKGDLKSRQRGFVFALMALCWCLSHGVQRTLFGSALLEHLRLVLDSYGIHGDKWEWTVKHSHLTRYDFVGLLSILLHHRGLATPNLESVLRRKPRLVVVR